MLYTDYMKRLIQILILLALAGVIVYFLPKSKESPAPPVTNFTECEQAGGSITTNDGVRTCTPPSGECCFTDEEETTEGPDVIVDIPARGDVVTSPLTIKGRARGNWFFEATLPIELRDQTGKVLYQGPYMTSENWMTTDYVNIETTINFPTPTTEFGNLIIRKDNPSGLPENDAEFVVPLRFR